MLRLYNRASGAVEELELREPGVVTMYVCGPTVYDVAHVGHGRFALVFDVIRRYLDWCGLRVRHVSNITDVDDKIIARAQREGRTEDDVAREYEAEWYRTMDALGIARPHETPHATQYVERMVELISDLEARDSAYATSTGVYFDVRSVGDYGLLAQQSLDSLAAGARIEPDEEKRSPMDFALWKRAKEGEPAWDSPWGPGRPGWHTECVAMSLDLLGPEFDLHGGGLDLAFPHHENERAQAAALGHRLSRHWVHNGFVEVGGSKMSKSLDNFTTIEDLLAQSDPRAYRLLVLGSHYRSPIEVSPATTAAAASSLQRLDAFARRARELPEAAPDEELLGHFREAMDDDLDTPRAMAVLYDAVRHANAAIDA
ncbi:MAG TPA: cysteine--tRNA ligase, partial [Solirubrobacteraceae bacterium]|nr:cysteine--tRNA ligase [Solirubrobacteraceae bacterium]